MNFSTNILQFLLFNQQSGTKIEKRQFFEYGPRRFTNTWNNQNPRGAVKNNMINSVQNNYGAPLSSSINENSFEDSMIEFTNKERRKRGLGPLRLDSFLSNKASFQANYINSRNLSGSKVHRYGRMSIQSRANSYGAKGVGMKENVSNTKRQRSSRAYAQESVKQWMKSPHHRQNLMCRYCDIAGVGISGTRGVTIYGYSSKQRYFKYRNRR